jgi:CheY-like chemotaxis protein
MRDQCFDALVADPRASALREQFARLLRADRVLGAVDDGLAILDPDGTIRLANPAFPAVGGTPVGRPLADALGPHQFVGGPADPTAEARAGRACAIRLNQEDTGRSFDARFLPLDDAAGPAQTVLLLRDVTAEVRRQNQFDALQRAGEELASLTVDQLSDMRVEDRIALLKTNLRRLVTDVLHYDRVEVRLLNRQTGRLESLLSEGMTAEAESRVLFARAEGNGVTGLVAATGRYHLCADTATDPHYLEGAAGARSSLTVPLVAHDEVIGTFNVESLRPDAFTADDVQFTQLFARELAGALYTLELLSAQQTCTASQSVDAVTREVALPVDEILACATSLLARAPDADPELREPLRRIIEAARSVKQCVQRVGDDLAPDAVPAARQQPLRGKRVLVADNDERVRRNAHGILGRFGCSVETARTGSEAVAMAQATPYDAVLADIRLPDLSGYEAYRQLRQAQPRARVILMTGFGYDSAHSIVKARQEGLRFVLYKPFRVDQLLDALLAADLPAGPPRVDPAEVLSPT